MEVICMKKRIIGIDIDGVVTDELHPNDNVWHNELCSYLGRDIERKSDAYYFNEAYDLPMNIINKFLDERLKNIYGNARPAKGALETINSLYKKDFKIFFITARNPCFENLTKKWLKQNGFLYTELIHEDNKTPLAVRKGITLFVEDRATTASELARNNIKVILVNKYHNKQLPEHNNITRVENWSEIKENINKYYQFKE